MLAIYLVGLIGRLPGKVEGSLRTVEGWRLVCQLSRLEGEGSRGGITYRASPKRASQPTKPSLDDSNDHLNGCRVFA